MRAKASSSILRGAIWALMLPVSFLLLAEQARAQVAVTQPAPLAPGTVRLVELAGIVEIQRKGAGIWDPGHTNQVLQPGDQLRTGDRSRAAILLSDLTVLRLAALSHIQVPDPKEKTGTGFFKGILYFFHRDKPGEFEFRTPTVSAVVRGTEFSLQVVDDNTTTLMLFDGEVAMTNQFGPPLYLTSGQGGVAKPNQAPQRTAMIEAANIIQWCLYYPAVLDPDEINLTAEETKAINDSLTAYRSGDLLTALSKYPADRQRTSDYEKVYYAGLLLSVGQVDQASELVQGLKSKVQSPQSEAEKAARLAEALRTIIAAVRYRGSVSNAASRAAITNKLATASELLAESYQQQAQGNLDAALSLAQQAREKSPKFGFAWEREAELEFSFGRTKKALTALETSLQLAPRNAQALALKGFLLSAENKIPEAITYFDRAIAIDGALANAWLGRGLCQIRQGQAIAGRTDLQVAATLEPHRAVLRSYLAKAFNNEGDNGRALKEIGLAKRMDTNDPTAWLYSALILQQENRINEAVEDLEKSEELNDNRRIYRSRLLLDQDRAVRGANLATIYQDAGMVDVSIREAARAVNLDYGNYSAHLFLANSYNALRDPHQINLRYETPAIAEYLVANLLADVRAGTLSPAVTQQEYSKLFERDRFGIASTTEYLSRGDWAQGGALYGIYGNTSFAFEASYLSFNGQRPNNELDQFNWSVKYKQHLTPQDSIYAQVAYGRANYGDLTPNYFNAANPDLKVSETQDPIVLAGYHREWGPGNHTLFLAGRLHDNLRVTTTNSAALLLQKTGSSVDDILEYPLQEQYQSVTEIYSTELQQIFQREQQTVILGARYQDGEFHTEQTNGPGGFFNPFVPWTGIVAPSTPQNIRSDFQRANFYGYYHYQFADPALPLHLIGGVSYDRIMFPVNFRFAPISTEEKTIDQVSPKLGLIWTPWKDTTIRAAWSRSLGGASIDQSFQLEPSQIAGFNQAWRSIIPEAVAGANAGAKFENWNVAWDQKFPTKTYAGLSAEYLKSKVKRVIGQFDFPPGVPIPLPFPPANSGTPQTLDYNEKSLAVTLNQLLSDGWSLGARYRISAVELREEFPELVSVPAALRPSNFIPSQDLHATLHQANLFAIYNHPSGFFGQFESLWYAQNNRGYAQAIPGDDFWQFNVFAGYRLPGRWAEITVGVLNLTDQDYRLNPLNLTPELPRTRTFYTALRFAF